MFNAGSIAHRWIATREEEEERAGLFFTSRGHHTLGRSVPKSRFSMGEVAFMTAILLA